MDLPQYQYQVAPRSDINLPSPMAVASLFGPTVQKLQVRAARGGMLMEAGSRLLATIMQQTARLQEAHDLAQLNKVKAGYYAAMKDFTEQLPSLEVPVANWLDEYKMRSDQAAEEVFSLLEETVARYPLSPKTQAITRDDFQAWRVQQDANFATIVYQNQRIKMADVVGQQIRVGLQMVRNNPDYLANFLADVQEYINKNVVSAEFGSQFMEQAKQIAGIAAVYEYAKKLGPTAGAAWLADDANLTNVPKSILPKGLDFLALDEEARDRVRRDNYWWGGRLKEQAERAKRAEVDQADREYIERYFYGLRIPQKDGSVKTMWLTQEDVKNDPRLIFDPNAPEASAYANDRYEHWMTMLRARDEAAQKGQLGRFEVTDDVTLGALIKLYYDRTKGNEVVEKFITDHHGSGLSNEDTKTWLDKLKTRSIYKTKELAVDMITSFYDNTLQFEESEAKILELRTEEAQSLKQLSDAIDKGDLTEKGVLELATNLVAVSTKRRVGRALRNLIVPEPEKRELSAEQVYWEEMVERYTKWKGAPPIQTGEIEGQAAFFDGTYWYRYYRRTWQRWDGKLWVTIK